MDVDWSKLIACDGYASAERVPQAIEMLFEGAPENRRKAYFGIDNYVVVQGGLYESAPNAVRLLVDRLMATPEKLNIEILDILFELANGRTLGDKVVENGPLKGRSIERLCRETVRDVLPLLAAVRNSRDAREQDTIRDLLELYEEYDSATPRANEEPGA